MNADSLPVEEGHTDHCDVTECDRPADIVIVGEAGDLWLCDQHGSVDYCGCCGNEPTDPGDLWCSRCIGHVGANGQIHERTWFAMTGEECPHA